MEVSHFKDIISGEGLKSTKQREEIINIFLNSQGHRNLSQIYSQVLKINPRIGYATVYRTLKLLTRLGLAAQRKFAGKETCYEPILEGSHHDHLICLNCGRIIEFEDKAIESLQNRIARHHNFKIYHHRMELYGQCANCGTKRKKSKGKN